MARVQSVRQQAVALLDEYAPEEWTAGRDGTKYAVEAYSKPGVVFVASGCHSLVVNDGYGGGSAAEVWASALEDLRLGVEPCTEVDCEGCDV